MNYLKKKDIVKKNYELALNYEGFFAVYNENALEYLVEAPQAVYFGQERYPSIFEKAACYAYFIIKDHIFTDGNKRTGMKSALLFLELNGYTMNENVSIDHIVNLALGIAKNELEFDDIVNFFKNNALKK